ncbi:unnamed protein product [Polarella glacialis]|uniref:Mei2-like C-terminal RNA recognition motif domain-containing protein n=1 Tax=Polarella glacialis TaxID=89957 RepID=A0A813HMB1_POLGL|nr:unnamed protein product [Polarella glacialis]
MEHTAAEQESSNKGVQVFVWLFKAILAPGALPSALASFRTCAAGFAQDSASARPDHSTMFPAQPFVICVPVHHVDPFLAPAPQYQQHKLEQFQKPDGFQKEVPQTSLAKADLLELLRSPGLESGFEAAVEDCSEDVFDYSTPEPSPRLWKSSTQPTPSTQCPPNPDGTDSRATSPPIPVDTAYSPSPVAMHGCYAVMMPTIFVPMCQPMAGTYNPDGSYNSYFCERAGHGYFVPEVRAVQMPTGSCSPFGRSESSGQCSTMSGATDEHGEDAPLNSKEGQWPTPAVEEEACRPTTPPVAVGLATRSVPEGFTTLVIRNIPARYTQEMLLTEFIPDGSFDFFFLPYSFKDARTMRIAFINFRTHALALDFQGRWHRHFLQDHGRTKHLDVAAATVQGLEANLDVAAATVQVQFNAKSIARFQRVGMLPVFLDESDNRMAPLCELQRFGRI